MACLPRSSSGKGRASFISWSALTKSWKHCKGNRDTSFPACPMAASKFPERAWQELEVLGYDLNTCMGETTVILKSFFCALPPEELEAFRQKLVNLVPSLFAADPGQTQSFRYSHRFPAMEFGSFRAWPDFWNIESNLIQHSRHETRATQGAKGASQTADASRRVR